MTNLADKKMAFYGFTGLIDPNGAGRIAAAFNRAVNDACDEVHFCFSSIGGYVADGIYLYNHIRSLPVKVVAYNVGSVSSIAVATFVAAEIRYCSAHAMFMIHPTSMPALEMTAQRLQGALAAALADDSRTENILRERTTLPEDLLSARKSKDVHITPDMAVAFGLVCEIKEFSLPRGNQIIQI